jgi:hypothetical protein
MTTLATISFSIRPLLDGIKLRLYQSMHSIHCKINWNFRNKILRLSDILVSALSFGAIVHLFIFIMVRACGGGGWQFLRKNKKNNIFF